VVSWDQGAARSLRVRVVVLRQRVNSCRRRKKPSNKAFKLTKLSPAPSLERQERLDRRRRLVPAPTRADAGTASQLNASVRPTRAEGGP